MVDTENSEVDGFTGRYNHVGAEMDNASNTNQGIRLLIQKCREEFRLPENSDFYSENNYREAERKYVKFCLTGNSKSYFHSRVYSK